MILTTVFNAQDSNISSLLSHAIISPVEWENPLLTASYCPPSGSLHQNEDVFHFLIISKLPSVEPPSIIIYSRF